MNAAGVPDTAEMRAMTPRGARRQLSSSERAEARRHRRRRTDSQLSARHRDLRRASSTSTAVRSSLRRSSRSRREAPRSGRGSSRTTSSSPSTAARSTASPTCSAGVRTNPGDSLTVVVKRGERDVTLQAVPDLKEHSTAFGKQRIGLWARASPTDPANSAPRDLWPARGRGVRRRTRPGSWSSARSTISAS